MPALVACRYVGRVEVTARAPLLAVPSSAGTEETWINLVDEFPPEDHAIVSAAVAMAVLAGSHRKLTTHRENSADLWPFLSESFSPHNIHIFFAHFFNLPNFS